VDAGTLFPAPQFTLDAPEKFRTIVSPVFVLAIVVNSVFDDHVADNPAETVWRAVVSVVGRVVVV
jgi:hypothetical protein